MQIYSLLQFQVKHLNLEGCGPEGNTLQFFSSDKLCTALCLAWFLEACTLVPVFPKASRQRH